LAGERADIAGRDPREPTGFERVGSGDIEDALVAISWKGTVGSTADVVDSNRKGPAEGG
jgi:hypothetical protein